MKTIEQRYPNLEAFLKSIEGINMAKKTAKRKYTKKAPRWTVKRQGNKLVAQHAEGPEIKEIVDNAIQRMTSEAESAPQVWFSNPQKPGLHLMRHANGDNTTYDVVRAVFKQNGVKDCCSIMSPREEHTYNMAEFTNPQFQKVQE